MKIRKQFFVMVTLLTCSCAGRFEMKKDGLDLTSKEAKHPTVFGIKFNYDNKKTSANPISGCRFHFSGDGSYELPLMGFNSSESSYEYKVKKDYVFIDNNSGDIYLSAIECFNYRVLYNKFRLKRVQKKMLSNHTKVDGKVAYGGDLEINWDSKEFNFTDLFNFGHMGYSDDGSFSINSGKDYESYKKFMKEEYGINSDKLINVSDR